MSLKVLSESGGALRASESGKWQATLLTPGTGSSGVYSEEMLAEYGSRAFPKGMKLWWGHPKDDEGPGDRDARDQWGVLDEDAAYEPGEGLVGKIRLLPHWKDVVESLGDQASLSIYAMGESDKDGNVTALKEHFTNSVDIVSYPGRIGSGLKKKLEAARASHTPTVESSAGEEEKRMDEKDIKAIAVAVATAVSESIKPVVDFVTESKNAEEKAAQAQVDDQAIEAAVDSALTSYEKKVEAIEAETLFPSQVEELRAEARKGADVAPLIEKAKKLYVEATTATGANAGGYVHESANLAETITFKGFGGKR